MMEKLNLPPCDDALVRWFDSHARVLPWRDNPTPYRVWVSEIMLQQTRVDTVKPYFERFVAALPTVEALAQVEDRRLFKLWEGLGYYSRASNLKAAAQQMTGRFGGSVPAKVEELLTLPGIGEYTAGAIASIAYGVRVPAVDGNVLRVITRLLAYGGDITKSGVKAAIREAALGAMPDTRAGAFNQALMELGATVCLPGGEPRCADCPLCGLCEGHRAGTAQRFPVKPPKKPQRQEEKTVFLLVCEGKVAVRKRPDTGLLGGLWEFPNVDGLLSPGEAAQMAAQWGAVCSSPAEPLPDAKHVFTHIVWQMKGFCVRMRQPSSENGLTWVTPDELSDSYTVPTAFKVYKKILPRYVKTPG